MTVARNNALDRRDVVKTLLVGRDRALVVAGLGAPAWDCAAAGDHPLNFYLWGAMGSAAMIGLGIALAQPEHRVIVVTGDGEILMGLSSLATIAVQAPRNLALVVLDNERYGETGMQATHTADGVDLAAIAQAAGFARACTVRDTAELTAAAALVREAPGPVVAVIKVSAAPLPLVLPEREGTRLKDRFRDALLG